MFEYLRTKGELSNRDEFDHDAIRMFIGHRHS